MGSSPRTALAIGRAIQDGALDPVTLARECLDRASASEAVFIALTPERALAEAEAAARRQKLGTPLGPLDGVPLAWKDLFDIRGTLTTAGSRILAHTPAEEDATAVRHATGAGMVCIGKTNLSELAYSGLGLNPHYGTPHHAPADSVARVPGGSSSGSAIAVAQGIVPAAIGTDTAGSLRVPAAFNGLVSYRPSRARHDRQGVTPLAPSLDTIGAMATTVQDCLAIDDTLRGRRVAPRVPAAPECTLIILDTGCLEDERLEPAVRRNLETRAEGLARAGFHVIRRRVASVGATLELIEHYGWLGAAEAYTEYRSLLAQPAAERMDPRVRQRLLAAREMTPDAVVTLYRRRRELQQQLQQELAGAFLLTPTVAHAAPELASVAHDPSRFAKVNLATLRLSMVASFLDAPALALPSGLDKQQRHTSLQLSAPCGEDEPLLRAALAISEWLA